MKTETITVDASRYGKDKHYHLAFYLAEYTADVCLERFPAENGYYTLHELPLPKFPYPAGSVLDMLGQFHPADGGAVADRSWLIRIEFGPPSPLDEVKTTVRCKEPAVEPYFEKLVEELQRFTRSTEPKGIIASFFERQALARQSDTGSSTAGLRDSSPKTPRYPRPAELLLTVPRSLEIVDAALLNHAEDWRPTGVPRLEAQGSPSDEIRRYKVEVGSAWLDGRGNTERDHRLKLGTIRLTGAGESQTKVLITRGYWEVNDDREYLTGEKSIKLYQRFFDQLTETLVASFEAESEQATGIPEARWSFGFGDLVKVIDNFCAHLPGDRGDRVDFERRPVGETVVFVFRLDGIEIGRLIVSPLPDGRYELSEQATAIARAGESHDIKDIPQEERERNKLFGSIMKDLFHYLDRVDGKDSSGGRARRRLVYRTELEERSSRPAKGGRPSNPENDWAYQQIKDGRDKMEVFDEWRQRRKDSGRSRLADPLDSFEKVIGYRKQKERREKKE